MQKTAFHMTRFFILFLLYVLSNSNVVWAADGATEQSGHARVRFIVSPYTALRFDKNIACFDVANATILTTPLFMKEKNVSIGMPETPNVVSLKNASSKAFYQEYAVAANEPLTIQASYYSGSAVSYGPVTTYTAVDCNVNAFFIPEDKGDYEATISHEGKTCQLSVVKIDSAEPVVKLNPVKLKRTYDCIADDNGDTGPDSEAQKAGYDEVTSEGVAIKRMASGETADLDRKVEEFFAKRRTGGGFPLGESPQCPHCPEMTGRLNKQQTLEDLPQTGDPEADGWMKMIQPELNRYVLRQESYFDLPSSIVPIPCEGADEDMRKAAGFLDLPERPWAKQQNDESPNKVSDYYYDVRLWPVKASCSNGKLNGEVDLWISGVRVIDDEKSLWVDPKLAHVRFTAVEGKPAGLMNFTTRSEIFDTIEYKDPVKNEELKRKGEPFHSEVAEFEYRQADKEKDPRSVNVTYIVGDPVDISTYDGPSIKIKLPFSAGRTQILEFKGPRKTARYLYSKDGKMDGLAILYSDPKKSILHPTSLFSRRGIVSETKECYKNWVRVSADQCVDE